MSLKATIFGAFFALIPPGTLAAEPGKLAPTSTAKFSISLAIQPSIHIKTVSDVALNISDRSIDATFTKPFCVRGSAHGRYTVVAYGTDQDAKAFALRNSDNNKLPYHVAYRGTQGSSQFDPLSPGVPSRVYGVLERDTGCDDTTAFIVTFRSADLRNAGSGLYSGSLTLLVSPL